MSGCANEQSEAYVMLISESNSLGDLTCTQLSKVVENNTRLKKAAG